MPRFLFALKVARLAPAIVVVEGPSVERAREVLGEHMDLEAVTILAARQISTAEAVEVVSDPAGVVPPRRHAFTNWSAVPFDNGGR